MKYLLTLCVTLMMAALSVDLALAKQPLKAVSGVPFGTQEAELKKRFTQTNPRANFDSRSSSTMIFFTGGFHLEKPVSVWAFKTTPQSGLHTAIISFKPSPSYLIPYYSYLKIVLNQKYGPSKKPIEVLQAPYKMGQEIEAIQAGKGQFLTFWKLDENKTILLKLTEKATINLVYQDSKRQLAAKNGPKPPPMKSTLVNDRPEKYGTIIKLIQTFNDPKKALSSVEQLIKQYPNYPEAYVIKAAILFEQKHYQQVINALTISATKAPTTQRVQAESYWLKGKAHSKLFQCVFAQNNFKSACELGKREACSETCP